MLALAAALLGACEGGGGPLPPTASPAVAPAVALEPALGGRRFDRPIEVGAYPGGRLFVAEQAGLVTVLSPDGAGATTLLDIRDRVDAERGEGLLSVALDPAFEENGHLWAYYFAADASRTVLARFEVAADVADPATELVVLDIPQPGFNQNGGAIRFGPDAMLYLSLGDGSASLDPFQNGQDLGTLLGAVVRIDVRASTASQPYAVPPDNPFVGVEEARPEIWAYGLRNPWRIAFDPLTGALWGGDVQVSTAEEVNRLERGGNYGWNVREGFDCLGGGNACTSEGLIPPVAVYAHEGGRCAVIGGVVYRGSALPDLDGAYLYGDFCSGEIFALDVEGSGTPRRIAEGAGAVSSFGTDAAGAVYVASYDGAIWRLVAR